LRERQRERERETERETERERESVYYYLEWFGEEGKVNAGIQSTINFPDHLKPFESVFLNTGYKASDWYFNLASKVTFKE
jgi:hypothetical protein